VLEEVLAVSAGVLLALLQGVGGAEELIVALEVKKLLPVPTPAVPDTLAELETVMERRPVADAQLVAQLLIDALPALLLLPVREIALLPVAAVVKEGVVLPVLQLQALVVALTSEVGVAVAVAHGLLAVVGVGRGMVPVAEVQGVG
jgi:hypothetical protein